MRYEFIEKRFAVYIKKMLFQLTFVEDVKGEETGSSGSCGRQLVPGLLYLDDKASKNGKVS